MDGIGRFTSLAKEQRGARGDGMQAIVQAAISGLLVQQGHRHGIL
ncbi:hypothetical protein ACFWBR_30030 [Streptomyces sp. NPDC060006]|nr:hypothetical protein [Streptomyces sp. BV286]